MSENKPLIFISYASPDRDRVLPFFEWSEEQGLNVWIDCRRLKAGQNWDIEINRALSKATFVIAFVSNLSFDRRGYLQRELKIALDKLKEKLIDDIYLIPVLLDDDVQIPEELKGMQCVRASEPQCREQIIEALQYQMERIGFERQEIQEKEQIFWTSKVKREGWDGIPGYEVELQFLEFHSQTYPNAPEIGEFIRGELLSILFQYRAIKFFQSSEVLNYGQDKYMRTDTYEAHCSEPIIVGKVITLNYSISSYGSGAAHPNYHFQTYSFLLEPVIQIRTLEDIFQEPKAAFAIVQSHIREELYKVRISAEPEAEPWELEREWVDSGTEKWEDLNSFVFRNKGIEILFAPYSVAAYALGAQAAEIPYEKIRSLMRNEYVSALGIPHLTY